MKLPKTVYVRVADEDSSEPYLAASETIEDAIDEDGPSTIGVYELTHTVTATKTVTVTPSKKRRA